VTPHDHPRLVALLRAILAAPEADGPRLAYSDVLEELGDGDKAAQERAEFVRVGVELGQYGPRAAARLYHEQQERAGKPCETPGCRWCALRRREAELLGSHRLAWLPRPLMDLESERAGDACEYRRGFVDAVTLPTQAFLDHAGALFGTAPLTGVKLADREPQDYHNNAPHLNPGRLYGWWHEGGGPRPHDLPGELWERVARHPECQVHGRWADFATRDLAVAALSAACVVFGRAAVHLPAAVGT
jgi:uncharacterized protein (TIGR02996 family)